MNRSGPIQSEALTLIAMPLGLVTGLIPSFCIFRTLSNGTVDLTVPLVVGCSSLWVVMLHRGAKLALPGYLWIVLIPSLFWLIIQWTVFGRRFDQTNALAHLISFGLVSVCYLVIVAIWILVLRGRPSAPFPSKETDSVDT